MKLNPRFYITTIPDFSFGRRPSGHIEIIFYKLVFTTEPK